MGYVFDPGADDPRDVEQAAYREGHTAGCVCGYVCGYVCGVVVTNAIWVFMTQVVWPLLGWR